MIQWCLVENCDRSSRNCCIFWANACVFSRKNMGVNLIRIYGKNKPQEHQQSINNLHFYTVVQNSTGNVWYGLVSWNMWFWDAFWMFLWHFDYLYTGNSERSPTMSMGDFPQDCDLQCFRGNGGGEASPLVLVHIPVFAAFCEPISVCRSKNISYIVI